MPKTEKLSCFFILDWWKYGGKYGKSQLKEMKVATSREEKLKTGSQSSAFFCNKSCTAIWLSKLWSHVTVIKKLALN